MIRSHFKQADREALTTLGLYAFFFLWWTIFAFGFSSTSPDEYEYTFGFPSWFFYSCILGYPVMTVILWIVIRKCFADIPLDESDSENSLT